MTHTQPRRDSRAEPPSFWSRSAAYGIFKRNKRLASQCGDSPFFRSREGINNHQLMQSGQTLDNFSSYNYLGLAADPSVIHAAQQALARFGASVCASRMVAGEIELHRQLEDGLAAFLGTEDCMTYVSGYATNVSTIGHLFDHRDLILYDEQMHNSGLVGWRLSGAQGMAFRHNYVADLERLLLAQRAQHRQVLILVEGVYSMEGGVLPLPDIVRLKQTHDALLMVDEAHSIGVLGATGAGIGEHFGIARDSVDLWMGTLSKALGSCGGYIAGRAELIDYLRWTSPGFVFSVGMPPASAAAALEALCQLRARPALVAQLRDRSRRFLHGAQAAGLDTGQAAGTPVVPVILRDTDTTIRVAHALYRQGIQVAPIFHPAVAAGQARLRFFITAEHTPAQIDRAVMQLTQCIAASSHPVRHDAAV